MYSFYCTLFKNQILQLYIQTLFILPSHFRLISLIFSKIISVKITSPIFFATVLVLGTIAAVSPSFIVGAQADSYYGMDTRYVSYEQDYTDRSNYEPTEYPSYKPEYPSYEKITPTTNQEKIVVVSI